MDKSVQDYASKVSRFNCGNNREVRFKWQISEILWFQGSIVLIKLDWFGMGKTEIMTKFPLCKVSGLILLSGEALQSHKTWFIRWLQKRDLVGKCRLQGLKGFRAQLFLIDRLFNIDCESDKGCESVYVILSRDLSPPRYLNSERVNCLAVKSHCVWLDQRDPLCLTVDTCTQSSGTMQCLKWYLLFPVLED